MTKEDVERMVREAEANTKEDTVKKAKADLRNEADGLVYAVEKHLSEAAALVSASNKSRAEMLIGELKQKIKDDTSLDSLKKAVEDLTNHFQQMQKEAQEAGSKASNYIHRSNRKGDLF